MESIIYLEQINIIFITMKLNTRLKLEYNKNELQGAVYHISNKDFEKNN